MTRRRAAPRTVAAASAADAYPTCCGSDADAWRRSASPEEILRARYDAYVERKPDLIMDTTHPSNEEHDADRDAWRARILDFAAAAKFVDFQVYDSLALDDDSYSITWNARIKVLDGMIDERLVETKDFVERSLFLREGGAWYYLKGDPDFKPKNIRVEGPLDPKPSPPKRKASAAATKRVAEKVSR